MERFSRRTISVSEGRRRSQHQDERGSCLHSFVKVVSDDVYVDVADAADVVDVVGAGFDVVGAGVFGSGAGGGYTSGSQSEPDDSREHTIS